MSEWVSQIFKNKIIMTQLVEYLPLKSIFSLALSSKTLYSVWKYNSLARHTNTSSWDKILNLSFKCAFEFKWNIMTNKHGASAFSRILKRISSGKYCLKCYRRLCEGRYVALTCFINNVHCKTYIKKLNDPRVRLHNQNKYIYKQDIRRIVFDNFPFVSKRFVDGRSAFQFKSKPPRSPKKFLEYYECVLLGKNNRAKRAREKSAIDKIKNKKIKK